LLGNILHLANFSLDGIKTIVVNIWNSKKMNEFTLIFFQMWSTSLFTGFGSATIRPFSWLTLNYSK
jgi:hypothetical protein